MFFYAKLPIFVHDPGLTHSRLSATHAWLKDVEAEDLEDAFFRMQGEIWSPNGEGRSLIEQRGLLHSSMSVGDVIYDKKAGEYWEVQMDGFRRLDK